MKRILFAAAVLALAVPALAKDTPCESSKKNVAFLAARHDCPDEEAEAAKVTCTDNVRDTRRLADLGDACLKKPKKKK